MVLDSPLNEMLYSVNNSSTWQGALEDPPMLKLYCNSLAIQNTNQLHFMILLAPKPLRNKELKSGMEPGIHSSSMQSHLGGCHNLHLGLKAQSEPEENTFLIRWIIQQMLVFGVASKGACWQLAWKAMAPARLSKGRGEIWSLVKSREILLFTSDIPEFLLKQLMDVYKDVGSLWNFYTEADVHNVKQCECWDTERI